MKFKFTTNVLTCTCFSTNFKTSSSNNAKINPENVRKTQQLIKFFCWKYSWMNSDDDENFCVSNQRKNGNGNKLEVFWWAQKEKAPGIFQSLSSKFLKEFFGTFTLSFFLPFRAGNFNKELLKAMGVKEF